MLSKYTSAAMKRARFETLDNGRIYGAIPVCNGCWAEAATQQECKAQLTAVLQEWISFGFELGHRLPVIDAIDLNP